MLQNHYRENWTIFGMKIIDKWKKANTAEIIRMLAMDVIELSPNQMGFITWFSLKENGNPRCCVDQWKSKPVTTRHSYSNQYMDKHITYLGNGTIFFTLNANSRYWQVEIAKRHRDKAYCTCHRDLIHLGCMPFWLKNAQATFQRAMDVRLTKV